MPRIRALPLLGLILVSQDCLGFTTGPRSPLMPPSSDASNESRSHRWERTTELHEQNKKRSQDAPRKNSAYDPMHSPMAPTKPIASTRLYQSSIALERPRRRMFEGGIPRAPLAQPPRRDVLQEIPMLKKEEFPKEQKREETSVSSSSSASFDRFDVALFVGYFCNVVAVTLSVVMVPAMAAEFGMSSTALVARVAALAPLGGGFGKCVNGLVAQRLGGRTSSWTYLIALAVASYALSITNVGMVSILIAYEFLASIQWTSGCHLLDQHFGAREGQEHRMARGIAVLSMASTSGALFAKFAGSALLQATGNDWRTVSQAGAVVSLIGALAMGKGIPKAPARPDARAATGGSGLAGVKRILSSRIFWGVGLAHSLGYLARSNDRLLIMFLQDVSALPRGICVGLTSSITAGFLYSLSQGRTFTKLPTQKDQSKMLKRSYVVSVAATLGLAACGLNRFTMPPKIAAAAITVLSGVMASQVAFPFYQLPNLCARTMFSGDSTVALSLIDAVAFFTTAQVLMVNRTVLDGLGWSASWSFLAAVFAAGGMIMTRSVPPVLRQAKGEKEKSS